ncbi:single-stranded-DNA-specific exonuclease RecJ [Patescibacteria group bacterium]|nr:single-stranded-DNA-specific exonuclease RecJ [Patescibacteria group bacterium]
MQKRWQCIEVEKRPDVDQESLELPNIGLKMLARRDILTQEQAEEFLNPDWEHGIHDPFLFGQMQSAVERILLALDKGQKILVFGDYDADGVTGSAVIASTIKMLAQENDYSISKGDVFTLIQGRERQRFFNVFSSDQNLRLDVYIPHREQEGYGLSMSGAELICDQSYDLIITVDCGIANVKEISYIKSRGIDVIVVDHHQFGEELPDAILIHPKLPGENYPFKDLAAVGVAWKVSHALTLYAVEKGLKITAGWEKWLLDLVSIATVTDIVPLKGENRVVEKFGLMVINKKRRPGLKALLDVASWRKTDIDSEVIGFVIGPRINAAGRMEHAFLALDLLLEDDPILAEKKAEVLETVNKTRQKATEALMKEAEVYMQDAESNSLLFAWSENWSPSLVGLAAGRYTDRFGRPAIFVGSHDGVWIGSGRSIPAYNITEAVRDVGHELLTRYGGHAQACGFSLDSEENISIFAKAIQEHATKNLQDHELVPELEIEAELELEEINSELVKTLKRFEPYGEGNPRPIFMVSNVTVSDVGLVGANKNHLRCTIQSSSGRRQKFIGFYKAGLGEFIEMGATVDLVFEVGESEWNGRTEIQCKLIDARASIK